MRMYLANFPGHWMGGHAVVWAENRILAIRIVLDELKMVGLKVDPKDIDVVQLPQYDEPKFLMISNGDY